MMLFIAAATAAIAAPGSLYIREYRVVGARELPKVEVEQAVYPYLGPERTEQDVEQARAALEKAYQDKGYQTVSVQVPPQQGRGGIVILQVTETTVGRLRVRDARYFLPSHIKARAQSLAEGKVVNFNKVTQDVLALNQLPDRRITPALRPGLEPGTVDIDLNVKDTLVLHGRVELNNRYTADTTELRLDGSISYNNLWQLGHSLGASFQVSPEDLDEVRVYSGYYLARLPYVDWLSLIAQGTKQESNVSTLGGIAVAGRGEVLGGRAIITLPPLPSFYHSISFGLDYKHFSQNVAIGVTTISTPITYYPFSATYNATWAGKGSVTELDLGLTHHLRGLGSSAAEFESNRFNADGGFIYLRGELAHTQELPKGFQVFGKAQGQIANEPLLNSEQFAGGGLGTARGYLEAAALGDNAIFGTLEVRSPSLLGWLNNTGHEWRIYLFTDGGVLTLNDPLPEQEARFDLASAGIGTRIRLLNHLNGSIDAGVPLLSLAQTQSNDWRLTFRVWGDF